MHLTMVRKISPGQRGFSILEVLISTMVFVIGFLGVIAMQVMSARFTRQAKDISLAANLGSDQLESLRIENYDVIFDSTSYFDQFGFSVAANDPNMHFIVNVDVETAPDGTYKDATVITGWTYTDGFPHEVRVTSRLIP